MENVRPHEKNSFDLMINLLISWKKQLLISWNSTSWSFPGQMLITTPEMYWLMMFICFFTSESNSPPHVKIYFTLRCQFKLTMQLKISYEIFFTNKKLVSFTEILTLHGSILFASSCIFRILEKYSVKFNFSWRVKVTSVEFLFTF